MKTYSFLELLKLLNCPCAQASRFASIWCVKLKLRRFLTSRLGAFILPPVLFIWKTPPMTIGQTARWAVDGSQGKLVVCVGELGISSSKCCRKVSKSAAVFISPIGAIDDACEMFHCDSELRSNVNTGIPWSDADICVPAMRWLNVKQACCFGSKTASVHYIIYE